jgi:hypothetical protein
MNHLPFKVISVLTGAVVAGEAAALLVGVYILGGAENPWISAKNSLFLVLDVLMGLGLVYLALAARGAAWPAVFYSTVAVALLSHGYREWEVLVNASNPFCANTPLLVVNNFKIAGLLASAILVAGLPPVVEA